MVLVSPGAFPCVRRFDMVSEACDRAGWASYLGTLSTYRVDGTALTPGKGKVGAGQKPSATASPSTDTYGAAGLKLSTALTPAQIRRSGIPKNAADDNFHYRR